MRKQLNLQCTGNKIFVKYQAQGAGFNPPTPLRTPLQCGQRLRWSALADKIKTVAWDNVNYRGTQF